jgi:WD40 repeat protein
LIRTLEGHTDGVNSLVCLNNGNLASASMDTTIILWDANRGLSLTILEGHSSYVFGLAIMNDEHLASSSGSSKGF